MNDKHTIDQALLLASIVADDVLLRMRQLALTQRLARQEIQYVEFAADLAMVRTAQMFTSILAAGSDADLRTMAAINEIRFLGTTTTAAASRSER